METNRQKKIGGVIQKDLADILQKILKENGLTGILISVTKVTVTTDLSISKVYLSIFPNKDAKSLLEEIKQRQPLIKHELAQRTRNQLRKVPELDFYNDDSLEYIAKIEESLERSENPISNPDLLEKRRKS
jgi:ribosome-binding factor A